MSAGPTTGDPAAVPGAPRDLLAELAELAAEHEVLRARLDSTPR